MTNTPTTPTAVVEQWRAEFERWAVKYAALYFPRIDECSVANKFSGGEYRLIWVDAAWEAWLNSRQTACIEIPQKMWSARGMSDGFNQAIDDVTKVIKSQGYQCRVKGE